jgi:predicted RNA methylase
MNTGLKRTGDECFYTKIDVSSSIVKDIQDLIDFSSFDLIVEPSAGSGSFLQALWENGIKDIKAYDINPHGTGIIKQDFLTLNTEDFKGKILTIGNPPFGRNSSLAIKFIKKICEFSTVFALILPKSFKKQSRIDKIPEEFHQIYIKDLDKNSFTLLDKSVDVPCSFFIYEKRDYKRHKKVVEIENEKYKIIKKPNDIKDIVAFRRVGANAGKFFTTGVEKLSEQSNYFIKFNDALDLSKCEFDTFQNTVGPLSISKKELIEQLNKLSFSS